jgi:SSS family solute:Na+ symporter
MNLILFLTIFFSFAIAYFIVGWLASKKVTTNNDYFLASRNLGFWQLTATLVATQIGAGALLGTSDKAFEFGWYGILYILSMSIGFLLLGFGFAGKLRALNVETTAQIFETTYKSILLRKVASLLSLAALCGIILGQVVASKGLLINLGISHDSVFLLLWLLIIGYTVMGGLKSVVITDAAQVIVVLTVFSGIFIWQFFKDPSSITTLFTAQPMFSQNIPSLTSFFPVFLMPALFSLFEQDLAQKILSAKTRTIAMSASLASAGFLLLFVLIPVSLGMQARLAGITVPTNGHPLVPYLDLITNDIIFALAICGITAAIVSCASSVLCAISSSIVQDFNWSRLRLKNTLLFSKIVTLLLGAGIVALSYVTNQGIIDILWESYEIPVSCLFVAIVFAVYKKNLNKNSAFGSVIAGFISYLFFKIYPNPIPMYNLIILSFSTGGYLIGSMIPEKK